MFLVKSLNLEHRDSVLQRGAIRIGTINYYREIEDATRQDNEEGLGHIVWTGQSLSGKDHNRIFSRHENVKLDEDWSIVNSGVPLHGSYPNFNAFTFCYSRVKSTSEILETSGGKASHHYFITDLPQFIKTISQGLIPIAINSIKEFEPDNADRLIRGLDVMDVTYRINYSDTPKHRTVNDENLKTFNPMSFHPQDFFQKSTSFSYEKEVRTVWLFFSKNENGERQLLSLPHPDERHVDLELGKLPISKKRRNNDINIKISTLKPEGA